jgi:hypothetical protein
LRIFTAQRRRTVPIGGDGQASSGSGPDKRQRMTIPEVLVSSKNDNEGLPNQMYLIDGVD